MRLKKNPLFNKLRWNRLLRLFHYFAPDILRVRSELTLALICTGGSIICVLARPWPIKMVFDYALIPKHRMNWALPFDIKGYGPMGLATVACVLLLGIALLWGLFAYNQDFFVSAAGQKLIFMIRRRFFAHVQRLSLSFHTASRTGDLVMRATGDLNMLREMLVDSVLTFMSEFMVIFAMIGVMLWMDWRLTMVSLAILPLLALTAFRFAQGLRDAVRRQRAKDGRMAALLGEVLHLIMVVQAFGRESHEDERFAVFNRRSLKEGMRTVKLEAGFERLVEILVAAGTSGVLLFGVYRVLQGFITPGDLIVFTGYVGGMYKPLRRIANLTTRLSKATVCGERIVDVLSVSERVKERKNATIAPAFRGQISVHNVGFQYGDGPEVLKDVSFRVESGQLVGIVGANGAGKSTLMALMPRLYDPRSGKVKIDGENLKHFTLDSLREQIGIVLQQPVLFGTTIRENIAYGKPEATNAEVEAAARAADIHDFIVSLAEGYDTPVAESGASLSGGQRQKICIARAIIKDPPILLLDEPTSGLDTASSAEVNATLNRIRHGKTSFRVAHRLEDVQNADLILVLSGGRVIESGTPQQLAHAGGWYQRIFDLQTGAGADMLEASLPVRTRALS